MMGSAELRAHAARGSVVAYRYWIAATGQCCGHPGREVVRTVRPGGSAWFCTCRACGRSWQEFDIHHPEPYTRHAHRRNGPWRDTPPEQHAADWSAKIERASESCWLVFYDWTLRAICRSRREARDVMLVLKGFDK